MAMVVSPSLAGAPGCFTFDDVAIKSSTLGVLSSFLKASILRRQVTSTHSRRMNAWKVKAMADTTLSAELADKPYAGSLERTLPNQYKITREDDLFDWNAQWYPAAVAADIDKRVPKPVTILGRDLVIWWDRNGEAWQVFDDKCPHRLAPLSEGRINEQGHLQCSYHGWSFAPRSGQCTLIPQAPADGVPVWESKRACAAVYPSVEQEGLIWFWPDTKLELKDIIKITKPPSIPALADPTFKDELGSRDLPYSYEQLIENLMDPSHVPFAHHGLQGYRHMAKPFNFSVEKVEKSGFIGRGERGPACFVAPCIFTLDAVFSGPKLEKDEPNHGPAKRMVLLFICIPVSPGHSKVIWSFRRNFTSWIDYFLPRWLIHVRQMLVLDSDLYLLHIADRKVAEVKNEKWEQACYVPTTSDAFVVAFRKWLVVYAGGAPDWGGKYSGELPPTPPRRQLMDRYWSHVKQCRHCTAALRFFEGAEVFLQALSVGLAGLVGAAALKPIPQLRNWTVSLIFAAVLCSLVSRWVAHFIRKTYHFHDYNHALVR